MGYAAPDSGFDNHTATGTSPFVTRSIFAAVARLMPTDPAQSLDTVPCDRPESLANSS